MPAPATEPWSTGARRPAKRAAPPAALALQRSDRGVVLVVDDQAVNRAVLSAQASAMGFGQVIQAACGDAAVAAFAAASGARPAIAAVLLDLQMPGTDGWAAAEGIRALEALRGGGRRCVIVACTAAALDGDVPRRDSAAAAGCAPSGCAGPVAPMTLRAFTLACGADAVVSKPIPTVELARVVHGLLQRPAFAVACEAAA
ncbi:hypothetical protein Rsub_10545 [Raphidocelis subcapitata]|uniref:Response regulatory domain-containing protein n=1 Tax=Raphidocelis subcapitata TaxID=307507 RepID=A0A2V0PJG9_9CHLO|nr:hypothetical protein Rsub_10545 [Raphidocelis subcapitata]|eukprot:GBF98133.1 hypothetical protein Rsub_10545 [Raphidocelis subcapitata]